MMRADIVETSRELRSHDHAMLTRLSETSSPSSKLLEISETCVKNIDSRAPAHGEERKTGVALVGSSMSGRSLRRLPVLAHARHIRQSSVCKLDDMLRALLIVAREELYKFK